MLAACVSPRLDVEGVDRTAVTRSIPATSAPFPDAAPIPAAVPSPLRTDADRASDEATIRNAVSSALLAELSDGRIPWENSATGSRGAISGITEYRESGVLCRRFTATRESYAGVALYRGDACLEGGGIWWMRSFAAA